jgi:hypothetical protein
MAALFLPVMLGFTGLAVDIGMVALFRTQQQRGADAAAISGAGVLLKGGNTTQARTTAQNYAQTHGYSSSVTTVNVPPTSGPKAGDPKFVEVIITQSRPTFFIRVIGPKTTTVKARAVAGVTPIQSNYALVVLNPTACSAYNHTSSANFIITGGGAIVNSSCKPSANQGGGSIISATHLDYFTDGLWQLSNNAQAIPPPTRIGGRIEDPLAGVARPQPCGPFGTPAGCIPASPDSGGTATNPSRKNIEVNGNYTLRPGAYYGGLKISAMSGTVTFLPGLYVFAGGGSSQGGFDFSGNMTLVGSGVTFFNTQDPYANTQSARACGPYSLQGSGNLTMTPTTSGPYKDLLFWQDDACTASMKYAGSTWSIAGLLYLPKAQLDVTGGGQVGSVQIIVDTFRYSGSNSVTINYTNYVDTLRPKMSLVE